MAIPLLRRVQVAVVVGIVIAAAIGFVFASGGSSQSTPVSWSSQFVAVPSALGSNVSFTSESCPAAGSCYAAGDAQSQGPNAQPIVATLSSGFWTAAPLPAPAPPPSGSWSTLTLTGISCASVGSCTAVGNATSTDTPAGTTVQVGFAEVLAGGTWTATALITPTNYVVVSMTGVSCVSATDCVAVGGAEVQGSTPDQGLPQAFAYSLVGAAPWTAPTPITNVSGAFRTLSLSAVSCTSSTSCVAVGTFFGTLDDEHPFIEQGAGSSWTSTIPPVPTNPFGQPDSSTLTGVSCATATDCQAVGTVTGSTGVQALVESYGGTVPHWADTEPVTGEPSSSLLGVSCASATACTAVGSFLDATAVTHSLVETLTTGGTWATTTGLDPSGAMTSSLSAVSCPLSACVAVGDASVAMSNGGTGIAPFAAVENGTNVRLRVSAPGSAAVGTPVSISVRALNLVGNPVTGYGGTVVFTSSDRKAVLPPPSTLTDGVGTFNVTFETPGPQTITATDSVDSFIAGVSNTIVVTSGKPPPPPPPPPPGTGSGGRLFAGVANGNGYWVTSPTGGVFSYDGAPFYGSLANVQLSQPIVGMASSPDGRGYWLVASDGGIFAFGDAQFYGSTGAIQLNQPVVGMAPTPDGRGYWLVASDGGIFSFGDTQFYGSTGAIHLNEPIVDMAATGNGGGYWLVASDGGIFAFGDAPFLGSLGGISINEAIVGMASTRDGGGYWMVGADGGVYAEGDATFDGSLGNKLILWPILGITATTDGGYSVVDESGNLVHFR